MNKKVSSSTLGLCLALSLMACTPDQTPEENIESARAAIASNEFDTAMIHLKNAIRQAPNDAASRFLLGDIYLQRGELEFSEKELLLAKELGFDEAQVLPRLAKALFLQRKYKDVVALEYTKQGLPEDAETALLVQKAFSHFRLGENDLANQSIEKANTIAADSIYSQLARSYQTAGSNIQLAITQIDELIQNNPNFSDAILLQGHLASAAKNYPLAIESYSKHLELLPQTYHIKLYLADVLIKNRNYDEAAPHIDFILGIYNNHPFGNQLKALVEFNGKRFEAAKSHIEIAIQNGLDTSVNRLLAGLSAFQIENYEQAHNHLITLEDKLTSDHPAKKALAITQLKLGYTIDASETLNEMSAISESEKDMYTAASFELIKTGELEKAKATLNKLESSGNLTALDMTKIGILKLSIDDFEGLTDIENAVSLDPSLPQAKMALAKAYVSTENYQKALELGQSWIKSEPQSTEGYNLAAFAQLRLKRGDKADELYEKALQIDENNIAALMFFARKSIVTKDFDDATRRLDKILSNNRNYIPALRLFYRVHNEQGDTAPALTRATALLEADPNNNTIRLMLAEAYLLEKKNQQALDILAKTNLEPTNWPDTFWLIQLQSQINLKDRQAAQATLEDWTKFKPKSERAWLRRVDFHDKLLDNEAALHSAQKGLIHLPHSLKLALVKANFLSLTGKNNEAQLSLNRLPDDVKQVPFAKRIQGHIYYAQLDFKRALPLLKDGYDALPEQRNVTLIYTTYKALNRIKEGKAFLKTHIDTNPNDVSARIMMANESIISAPQVAKAQYLYVVELEPSNLIALNNLAYLHLQDNELQQADKLASMAIEMAPQNPQILDTAGSIKIALGDKQAALSLLEKARRLAPNSLSIEENYKKAQSL